MLLFYQSINNCCVFIWNLQSDGEGDTSDNLDRDGDESSDDGDLDDGVGRGGDQLKRQVNKIVRMSCVCVSWVQFCVSWKRVIKRSSHFSGGAVAVTACCCHRRGGGSHDGMFAIVCQLSQETRYFYISFSSSFSYWNETRTQVKWSISFFLSFLTNERTTTFPPPVGGTSCYSFFFLCWLVGCLNARTPFFYFILNIVASRWVVVVASTSLVYSHGSFFFCWCVHL